MTRAEKPHCGAWRLPFMKSSTELVFTNSWIRSLMGVSVLMRHDLRFQWAGIFVWVRRRAFSPDLHSGLAGKLDQIDQDLDGFRLLNRDFVFFFVFVACGFVLIDFCFDDSHFDFLSVCGFGRCGVRAFFAFF